MKINTEKAHIKDKTKETDQSSADSDDQIRNQDRINAQEVKGIDHKNLVWFKRNLKVFLIIFSIGAFLTIFGILPFSEISVDEIRAIRGKGFLAGLTLYARGFVDAIGSVAITLATVVITTLLSKVVIDIKNESDKLPDENKNKK